MLDTFPAIAEHLLPRFGILLLVPIGLVAKNWRLENEAARASSGTGPRPPSPSPGWVRAALAGFFAVHSAALAWGVAALAGLVGELPGGP
jgi:hypothetical protein